MKIRVKRRQLQHGTTLVELLVAALLLSIGLMALVNMWMYSFRMTVITDDYGVAYNLGRQAMEQVKMQGFASAPEGSTVVHYRANQTVTSTGASDRRYQVTTSIVSSSVKSGTPGSAGAVPMDTAIRTVTVTVRLTASNQVIYVTHTYLARGGV